MRTIREWLLRVLGTFRAGRRDRDLEEELRLHMELAAEDARRRGDAAMDATRAARIHTGGTAQAMESLRDQRGWPWLQSLASDLVFAWRQLNKHRTASATAILSLALAVGATTAAFRLVNAVLWRTLPVAEPERLFVLAWNSVRLQGDAEYRDEFDYATYRRYSEVVGERAALMVVGMTGMPQSIVFDPAADPETATRQFVSGNVFPSFGIQPTIGRLLTLSDDVRPGGHPVAVISYDYWTRRFARDPRVLGRTFELGGRSFEIIGVGPRGFTGTEPGRITDVFIPSTMNVEALDRPGRSWFRIWLKTGPGVSPEQARQLLQAEFIRQHREEIRSFPADTPQKRIDAYLSERLMVVPAGEGASDPQRNLRRPLLILFALVVLVLLVACANVANLLTAQAVARTREMALRVSIGAGRSRLIQLVLVESVLMAILSSAGGAVFAAWAAPFVVSLVDLGIPLELVLDLDGRTIGFGLALTLIVTTLFGLAPAIRASSIEPLVGLKDTPDASSHRRLTQTLIGAQMMFCVFVLFVAGLLVATFANLVNRPLGFEHERVLLVDVQTNSPSQSSQVLAQLSDRLRAVATVQTVALAQWVPLSQNRFTTVVRIPGRPDAQNPSLALSVSPGFFDALRIGMVAGRDFTAEDTPPRLNEARQPVAGVGIVNEAFARALFNGENPIGRQVTVSLGGNGNPVLEIVGLVRDSVYHSVREQMGPTIYMPAETRGFGTVIVRTESDPLTAMPAVGLELSRMRVDLRRYQVNPYTTLVRRQSVFERLLAILSLFFAMVALLLAGIGLYGVLNYAVIQRRREIGVRMALGARAAHVVRRVTAEMLIPVGVGSLVGLAAGLAFGRVIESLLFGVKATDASTLAAPLVTLAMAAALAAVPPALRAVRIDPARTLRAE